MTHTDLSPNTQAILLLTGPLSLPSRKSSPDTSAKPLSPAEYRALVRHLRELEREPADLLISGGALVEQNTGALDAARLDRLLARGFLLAQALERWRARAIWILSRADAEYPRRLKERLGQHAPPVLYGCGDRTGFQADALAVVGSRRAREERLARAEETGRLAAAAGAALVSGGARGIDSAAMEGASNSGGSGIAVLADSLEREAMRRRNREPLLEGRLCLISARDPAASFHIGHAMQRNKMIYALADAALVLDAEHSRGGTWAGAVEQLKKTAPPRVYAEAAPDAGDGIRGLLARGARPWPDPTTAAALRDLLRASAAAEPGPYAQSVFAPAKPAARSIEESPEKTPRPATSVEDGFDSVRDWIVRNGGLPSAAEIAEQFRVSRKQAAIWRRRSLDERLAALFEVADLQQSASEASKTLGISASEARAGLARLTAAGVLGRAGGRPVRYHRNAPVAGLFAPKP